MRPGKKDVAILSSLKLTLHLKIHGWKTTLFLGWTIFRHHVSFRECRGTIKPIRFSFNTS